MRIGPNSVVRPATAHSSPFPLSCPPQYNGRQWLPQGWQGPLLLILPALVVLGLYSFHLHSYLAPKQAVIHQELVTETITTGNGPGKTTTTRREQRSVAHLTTTAAAADAATLTDWLSSTVKEPRAGSLADQVAIKPSHIESEAVVQASAAGTGLMNKWYYRFNNVQLARDKITVYYNPTTFIPPTEPHWVDIISGNTTSPKLPTMIVLKGDLHNTKWFYLPVEYLPADQQQPKCTTWVEPMAYLLQVRYSYNIWHTWNEGLMGLFQTLREQGQLPLAAVGEGGSMEEITDGMGEGCPYRYDPTLLKVVQEEKCPPRSGLLAKERCDPGTDTWCRPGAVVSVRRDSGGPVIIPFTASSVMNVWAHLYSSMTADVRDWSEIEGACFRSLIVGKSSTLNFYQAVNTTEPGLDVLKKYPRIDMLEARVEAMAVFKQYVRSAQKEYVTENEEGKGAAPWEGYRSRSLERLRRGVGPEDLGNGVLDGINAREVPGMLREERNELKQRWKMHDRLVERAVQRYMHKYGGAAEARAAAEADGSALETDYDDDYEGVAARAAKRSRDGVGLEMGVEGKEEHDGGEDEEYRRRRLLSSSSSSRKGGSSRKRRALQYGHTEHKHTMHSSANRLLIEQQQQEKKWFDKKAVYRHEHPRPVVTYMSRNFFSRGVLNEGDILAYVLARYNVTLRVTTFEEPLHFVMESLGSTDVMFGMHGAGWTNGLFIKRGATTLQMFPYGWRLPDDSTLRGYNYREIVLASECPYSEWVNPVRENAFFRRSDYSKKDWNTSYSLHPGPDMALPQDGWPGNLWIYQNTYVDMNFFGPEIDALMEKAGIKPMPGLREGDEGGDEER